MKYELKPVKMSEIPAKRGVDTRSERVRRFFESDWEAAEVDLEEQVAAKARSVWAVAIKRTKLPVECIVRSERLFLIRTTE